MQQKSIKEIEQFLIKNIIMGEIKATRFSGADWASELKEIMIVGVGGIGSWLSLSLSRIGHSLMLIDGDVVDDTNISGGQMYTSSSKGKSKVVATSNICREFGCTNPIYTLEEMYNPNVSGSMSIVITGLDNMKARAQVFERWMEDVEKQEDRKNFLFIDGRLLLETAEVFCIQGNKPEQIKEYREKWLFDDSEVPEADCTMKQTTFSAMGIAGLMTATLCNWLTNLKLEAEFREVPFQQRMFYPVLYYKKEEIYGNIREAQENQKEETKTSILTPV